VQIFRDSTKKWRSLDSKIQALTVKETTSKAHMQVQTNRESREKQPGRKPGPKRAWAGQPGPTSPAHSGPGSTPPLTYPPLVLFIAPWPKATRKFIRHPLPQDQEQEADWIAKGALVAFIYFRGFYTMIIATMSNIMGQSPCLS
jgi:hypothetical protein